MTLLLPLVRLCSLDECVAVSATPSASSVPSSDLKSSGVVQKRTAQDEPSSSPTKDTSET